MVGLGYGIRSSLEDVLALERNPQAAHARVQSLATHAEEIGGAALVASGAIEHLQQLGALVERVAGGEVAVGKLVQVDNEIVRFEHRPLAAECESAPDAVLE